VTSRIDVAPAAQRHRRKPDAQPRRRVQGAIELLANQPRPPRLSLLAAKASGGVRTGDYHVVYEIHDKVLLVLLVAVGHRREIYR
jgi:mRNA interferase RelE/StbE